MNTSHPFVPSQLNQSLCAKCYQDESKHGKVVCEACNNVAVLQQVNTMWICPDCFEKELSVVPESSKSEEKETTESIAASIGSDHRPTELEHSASNRLGPSAISKTEDFFNARTTAMSDRWKQIVADDSINTENKHYSFAKEIREHYLHFKSVLSQAIEVQLECSSAMQADQVMLNQLASKLREEERTKLHLQNIDYTPVIPKKVPKTVRMSKDDKIAAQYAQLMNIPLETAKRLLFNKISEVTGNECTCSATPGLCKIHSR